jgi:hypothetical protein
MKPFIRKKTEETPAIIFNPAKQVFQLVATSWPENALGFYSPIMDWLREYFQDPNEITVIQFRFDYFNTSSAKQIAKLLTLLKEQSEKHHVVIKWFFDPEDIDMKNAGKRYGTLLNMEFELIEKTKFKQLEL